MTRSHADRPQRERREADARYNRALTALDRSIVAASGRPLVREDFDNLATALIVFLQQITGFVESSDRQIAAEIDARLEQLEVAQARAAELRVQFNVLQRTVQAVRRDPGGPPRDGECTANSPGTASNTTYLAFEDEFRGSAESVAARVCAYVPVFHGTSGVVDLGCGRGEFLAALKAAGIEAAGVDANP